MYCSIGIRLNVMVARLDNYPLHNEHLTLISFDWNFAVCWSL
jgi:hypothetical protein